MDNEEIQSLLNDVSKTTRCGITYNDNIFSILQIENMEKFHSRFLRYLIENNWSSFKKSFGTKLHLPDGDIEYSCCEYECGAMNGCPKAVDGRIDIFFKQNLIKSLPLR